MEPKIEGTPIEAPATSTLLHDCDELLREIFTRLEHTEATLLLSKYDEKTKLYHYRVAVYIDDMEHTVIGVFDPSQDKQTIVSTVMFNVLIQLSPLRAPISMLISAIGRWRSNETTRNHPAEMLIRQELFAMVQAEVPKAELLERLLTNFNVRQNVEELAAYRKRAMKHGGKVH